MRNGEGIRQHLLTVRLLCHCGKYSLPNLLWAFPSSEGDLHQLHLNSQPSPVRECASVLFIPTAQGRLLNGLWSRKLLLET